MVLSLVFPPLCSFYTNFTKCCGEAVERYLNAVVSSIRSNIYWSSKATQQFANFDTWMGLNLPSDAGLKSVWRVAKTKASNLTNQPDFIICSPGPFFPQNKKANFFSEPKFDRTALRRTATWSYYHLLLLLLALIQGKPEAFPRSSTWAFSLKTHTPQKKQLSATKMFDTLI